MSRDGGHQSRQAVSGQPGARGFEVLIEELQIAPADG
jgi:hypothetical protein